MASGLPEGCPDPGRNPRAADTAWRGRHHGGGDLVSMGDVACRKGVACLGHMS